MKRTIYKTITNEVVKLDQRTHFTLLTETNHDAFWQIKFKLNHELYRQLHVQILLNTKEVFEKPLTISTF